MLRSGGVPGAVAAALLSLALLLSAVPAQAQLPPPEPVVNSVRLNAGPTGPITVCPGESFRMSAWVDAYIFRMFLNRVYSGNEYLHSDISHTLTNPILDVSTYYDPVRFVWYYFLKAQKIGMTKMSFYAVAHVGLQTFGAPRIDPIQINVACRYKVEVISTWDLNPAERGHTGQAFALFPRVEADANNVFKADSSVNNFVMPYGMCTGTASIANAAAHLNGSVTPDGLVTMTVSYESAEMTTAEGCKGKGQTGSGKPESITFSVRTTGDPYFVTGVPHTMISTGGSIPGNSIIIVERLP